MTFCPAGLYSRSVSCVDTDNKLDLLMRIVFTLKNTTVNQLCNPCFGYDLCRDSECLKPIKLPLLLILFLEGNKYNPLGLVQYLGW